MIKRIPFEWAEPGVDPTQQHHPLPRRKGNLKDTLPWIAGLVLVAAFGYQKFVSPRIETQAAQEAAMPVATATAQPGLLSEKSTAPPPTATATPMVTPTIPPTATATATPAPTLPPANLVTFGVFDNGQQLACWCNVDTGEVGGEDVEKCSPHKPSLCKGK